MAVKSLDQKLAAIHRDPSGCRDFILADAKDADMAFGVGAPGQSPEMHAGEPRFRTLAEYRDQIRQIVSQGLVDITLMSASTNAQLTIAERLFENSPVTPAARANDTSDIFVVRGGRYAEHPAQPFRTATIDHIQCGKADCEEGERALGANLGLYSITFNNRLEDDLRALEAYNRFRLEAEARNFRHFLELFDPNAPFGLDGANVGSYINDCIARTLAGVVGKGRPIFLKIVYHGPQAMEELVAYDPHLVVGILGGSAGTTYDAFKMLAEAQKYGARVALYGRKINSAECQLAFVRFLRWIVEGVISPEEAVKAYHGVLRQLRIPAKRSLADDMQLTTGVMSYSGAGSVVVPPGVPKATPQPAGRGCKCGGAEQATPASSQAADHQHCGCETKGAPADNHCGRETKQAAAPAHAVCGCESKTTQVSTPAQAASCGCHDQSTVATAGQLPDFQTMTQAEKVAWQQAKRDRTWGR